MLLGKVGVREIGITPILSVRKLITGGRLALTNEPDQEAEWRAEFERDGERLVYDNIKWNDNYVEGSAARPSAGSRATQVNGSLA